MSNTSPPTSPPPRESASGPTPPNPTTPPPAPAKPNRTRRILIAVVVVVVLAAVAVGVVLFLNRGDGTKRTANPIEVRRLVATFACTPANPTTPENLRLTAGQEVVKVPYAGCAVVGEVVGRVDRLEKVKTSSGNGECTVTLTAPENYGRVVDAESNVSDGQARALVAGGWLLDVRAVIDYPGRPSSALTVVFRSPDPVGCTDVTTALALQ
jgi:hypothetical protein